MKSRITKTSRQSRKKLTRDDVRQIKEYRRNNPKAGMCAIAKRFKRSSRTIYQVLKGEFDHKPTWPNGVFVHGNAKFIRPDVIYTIQQQAGGPVSKDGDSQKVTPEDLKEFSTSYALDVSRSTASRLRTVASSKKMPLQSSHTAIVPFMESLFSVIDSKWSRLALLDHSSSPAPPASRPDGRAGTGALIAMSIKGVMSAVPCPHGSWSSTPSTPTSLALLKEMLRIHSTRYPGPRSVWVGRELGSEQQRKLAKEFGVVLLHLPLLPWDNPVDEVYKLAEAAALSQPQSSSDRSIDVLGQLRHIRSGIVPLGDIFRRAGYMVSVEEL